MGGAWTDRVDGWLTWVVRYPWLAIGVPLLLGGASLFYAAGNLGVDTDPVAMLDEDLPFRQVQDQFRREFPGLAENILLAVSAPTPEQAQAAAADVHRDLSARADLFPQVFWPGASDFLMDNGLLLLSLDELDALADQLSQAQPLLGRLAADTDLVGLFDVLALAAEEGGEAALEDFANVHTAIARALEGALADAPQPLSWQRMIGGTADADTPARELLVAEVVLDFDRVMAGREPMKVAHAVRDARELDRGPVRMGITGTVALMHEELVSTIEGAGLAGTLALIVVIVVMAVGLRSFRLVAAALISLICGFAITLGFATFAVGRINLISIAFAVLYIGLGVNYAIHFLLRYREQLTVGLARSEAIAAGGARLAGALSLSALTTALGFLAFVPTAYAGVAELGLIASAAMGITLLMTYTLLPGLLAVIPPPRPRAGDQHSRLPESVIGFPLRHRRWVAGGALVLALAAAFVGSNVRFDSDPLNLRDPDSESVVTLRALLDEATSGYRNLQLLAGGPDEVRAMTARLRELPAVGEVVSLLRFVPEEQDVKLELIEELRWVLGPQLLDADWRDPPVPAVELLPASARLRDVLADAPGAQAARLVSALANVEQRLAREPEFARAAHAVVLDTLPQTMGRLARGLAVEQPVGLADIPEDLRRQWVSPAGSWLIQVAPLDPAVPVDELDDFVAQVRGVDPAVTGTPVLQRESGLAVSAAFTQAIFWAVIGIFAVVIIVLKNLWASLSVLTPLLVGGLFTLTFMVLFDQPFNFANVIAIPLLLGVGVDNGVHLVFRHRLGGAPDGNVLRTHTARAIVFGALTTALTFGNLMLSPHSGTASMGFVLAFGLPLMVLATLVVLPAAFGRTAGGAATGSGHA